MPNKKYTSYYFLIIKALSHAFTFVYHTHTYYCENDLVQRDSTRRDFKQLGLYLTHAFVVLLGN